MKLNHEDHQQILSKCFSSFPKLFLINYINGSLNILRESMAKLESNASLGIFEIREAESKLGKIKKTLMDNFRAHIHEETEYHPIPTMLYIKGLSTDDLGSSQLTLGICGPNGFEGRLSAGSFRVAWPGFADLMGSQINSYTAATGVVAEVFGETNSILKVVHPDGGQIEMFFLGAESPSKPIGLQAMTIQNNEVKTVNWDTLEQVISVPARDNYFDLFEPLREYLSIPYPSQMLDGMKAIEKMAELEITYQDLLNQLTVTQSSPYSPVSDQEYQRAIRFIENQLRTTEADKNRDEWGCDLDDYDDKDSFKFC